MAVQETWKTSFNSSPPDKMAAISQSIFSYALSRMKNLYFDVNFNEVCSSGPNLQ